MFCETGMSRLHAYVLCVTHLSRFLAPAAPGSILLRSSSSLSAYASKVVSNALHIIKKDQKKEKHKLNRAIIIYISMVIDI